MARPSKLTPLSSASASSRNSPTPRRSSSWPADGRLAAVALPLALARPRRSTIRADASLGFAVPTLDPAPETGGSIEGRVADAEEGLVAVILAAARRGSWQASAWLLERSIPKRWARPPARTIDAPRVPAPPGVFDEVDQLAARRARRAAGVPSTET